MDSTCQNTGLNAKHLLGQLNTARKEINNLRQQIKTLRYIHEKDVDNIKHLINLRSGDIPPATTRVISSDDIKPSTSSDDYNLSLKPIGIISTWFPSKRGTPRQTGICGKVPGKLELYNTVLTNPEHALEGLQDFSHMWILFYFHRNDSTHVRAKVAPPRLNGTRTGVFSTRSPHRPCPIGLSLVRITGIENNTIYFEGVDMVDQSPVLDIKPYIPQYDSPAYFERLSNRSEELNTNDSDAFECIEESASLSRHHTFNTANTDVDTSNGFRALIPDSHGRKCLSEMDQETDISRDEEIALRLQAEEFQGNPNFENYSCSRRFSQLVDLNFHNDISSQDEADVSVAHRTSQLLQNISSNVRAAFSASTEHNTHSSNSDLQAENLSNVSSRLQSINLSGHNNDMSYTLRSGDSDFIETHTSRNSRLLDGADGPSTVCGGENNVQ
ncbi:hypothetical protein KM043_010264 [Ampulex compressa]|nr:hypothetical protein KM043_010264 [Ampulex compressa]